MTSVVVDTAVRADSMNLAWQLCRTPTNNASVTTNDFTPPMPCDDPNAPWSAPRLVVSFKNSTTMSRWQGTTIVLEFYVRGPGIPDFWNFGPGGCSEGTLQEAFSRINPPEADGCSSPWLLEPIDPDILLLSNITVDATRSVVQYEVDRVRATLAVDLPPPTAPGGYLAGSVALLSGYANGSAGGPCSGCEVPACIWVAHMYYFSLTESRIVIHNELRQSVYWNVESVPGAVCPGVVAAKSATWGEVKALYR